MRLRLSRGSALSSFRPRSSLHFWLSVKLAFPVPVSALPLLPPPALLPTLLLLLALPLLPLLLLAPALLPLQSPPYLLLLLRLWRRCVIRPRPPGTRARCVTSPDHREADGKERAWGGHAPANEPVGGCAELSDSRGVVPSAQPGTRRRVLARRRESGPRSIIGIGAIDQWPASWAGRRDSGHRTGQASPALLVWTRCDLLGRAPTRAGALLLVWTRPARVDALLSGWAWGARRVRGRASPARGTAGRGKAPA